MKIEDMVEKLDTPGLETLRTNAERLSLRGTAKQKEKAVEALALIEAERTRRASLAPPPAKPARRRAAARKA
jgi:hypothetical protein